MIPIRIDDPRDPRLAPYAGVREPRLLRERGLLMAEGRFVVRRLLGPGRTRLQSLLLNEASFRAMAADLETADPALDVYVAPADVITAATGFNMHHGCLAVGERPAALSLEAALPAHGVVMVLERVADTDNIGSAFRNAEAFGVPLVLLSPGCGDPCYRKAIRTSSGATLVVPFAAADPWPGTLDRLRARGFVIAALTPDRQALDIGTFVDSTAASDRIAVLLGTEGGGLTPGALDRADARVCIRMTGALDSLNVATAAGIALHRLHDARSARQAGADRSTAPLPRG